MLLRSVLLPAIVHAAFFMVAPAHAQAGSGSAGRGPEAQTAKPDPFPGACVDCHKAYPDRGLDVRLSTLMARWRTGVEPKLLALVRATAPVGLPITGRHPDAVEALASIPDGCLRCHGRASENAPPFATLLHATHFAGGGENHFVALFGGECTHCHKLEATTGRWSIPSRAEPGASATGQPGTPKEAPPSSR